MKQRTLFRIPNALAIVGAGVAFLGMPAHADFTLLLRDVIAGGSDTQVNNAAEAESILALGAPDATYNFTDTSVTRTVVDVAGNGGGSYPVNDGYPDGFTGNKEDYILKATANVRIPAGDWTIGFGRDDGGYLKIDGITFLNEYQTNGDPAAGDNEVRFNGTGSHNWTFGTFTLASQRDTSIEIVMFERGGGDSFEVAFFAGHTTSFNSGTWDLLEDGVNGWTVQVAPLIDTSPPSIDTTSPASPAYPAANLVATFDEEIVLTGAGSITVTDTTDGTGTFTITLPDAAQVTTSGADLLIDPTANLEFGTDYEVTIDENAIQDLWTTPNAYGGTAAGEWTITTAAQDFTPPVISPSDPADDAINVAPGVNLVATFDENIVAGVGNITILDTTDGTSTQTLSVTDPQVSIAGNVLTIDPPADLEGATVYAVQIDAGAVENFSNVDFVGIVDTTTWNFTVTDTTTYVGPDSNGRSDTWNVASHWDAGVPSGSLNAVIPAGITVTADDASLPSYVGNLTIGAGSALRVEWLGSENELYDALGTPGQTVITAADNTLINCRAGGSVTVPEIQLAGDLTIVHSQSTQPGVTLNYDHGVSGPHTLILQGKGGSNANLNVANTCSAVLISVPSAGGIGVDVNANLAGSLGGGDVTVEADANGTPGGDLHINAADAMADTATLTLAGSTNSTLITMNADDTVDQLVVNGFPYPAGTYGASGSGASHAVPWVVGTGVLTVSNAPADATAPSLVSFSPADDTTGAVVAELFVLDFDEPVTSGPGNILVKNLTDATTTVVSAADAWQVSITETTVVINLLANLEGGKDYAIQVEPTAFTDLFGNPYPGITDDTSWNLSTVNPKTLFSDDFESPDVTDAESGSTGNGGTSQIADTSKWVRATQGYGAAANGIEDEAAGFFTDPVGEQAYRFSYTNSGVTTAEDVIGHLLPGATYTVSFDVVQDGAGLPGQAGLPWRCKLVTFNEGARHDDVRGNNGTTVLREVSGSAPEGGAYAPQSFTFTVDPTNPTHLAALGKDLAVRFNGATNSANIDNVVVSVAGETIAPTVVSFDDNVSGGPVTTPKPVVYTVTFDEAMDAATIGTGDFENGSSAGISISSVRATANPSVYEVTVATFSAGDLVLQIKSGAVLTDANGNAMDTSAAIADDTNILVEPGSGIVFANWIANYPGVGGQTGFGDDPDRDGLVSGLENFLGTDPSAFNVGLTAETVIKGASNTFTFTHPQNATPADDVSFPAYRWSTDLQTFQADGAPNGTGTTTVNFTTQADTPVTGTTTVTATITGAAIPKKLFVDVGVTQLSTGGNPYDLWAGTFGDLADRTPTADFDDGGLATGIEWVVGGDPTKPGDTGLAPTSNTDGTHLVFTYQRTDAANNDPNTAIKAEYGTDLLNWTDAVDGTDGVMITVTDGSPADTVEVKIPLSLAAPGTTLFARLNVTITP